MKCLMRMFALLVVAGFLVASCSAEPAQTEVKEGADLSSPRSTLETLVRAAAARDPELISQTFSPLSKAVVPAVIEGTMSVIQLDKMEELMDSAKIGAEKRSDSGATVEVSLKQGDTSFMFEKYQGRWLIVDWTLV